MCMQFYWPLFHEKVARIQFINAFFKTRITVAIIVPYFNFIWRQNMIFLQFDIFSDENLTVSTLNRHFPCTNRLNAFKNSKKVQLLCPTTCWNSTASFFHSRVHTNHSLIAGATNSIVNSWNMQFMRNNERNCLKFKKKLYLEMKWQFDIVCRCLSNLLSLQHHSVLCRKSAAFKADVLRWKESEKNANGAHVKCWFTQQKTPLYFD